MKNKRKHYKTIYSPNGDPAHIYREIASNGEYVYTVDIIELGWANSKESITRVTYNAEMTDDVLTLTEPKHDE